MTTRFAVRGIGVLAPGLAGWTAARDVLAGGTPWRDEPVTTPDVARLPVTERRRVNATSRWAIAAAEDACASLDGSALATLAVVFASADGDGEVLDQTLAALASPAPTLSPTLFHNSVFNAPVGYWSIATRSTGWATMICGGDGSFASALLEGASQARASGRAVLCACVDLGYPSRLVGLLASTRAFACAFVLDPDSSVPGIASVEIGSGPVDAGAGHASDPLVTAFAGNAASAAIPLLACIARGGQGTVLLPYLGGQALRVEVHG